MKVQPLARQSSLIVKEIEDETLVYDLEADKAHCLNVTAARVWKSCDGKTTVSEIAEQLGSSLNQPVDESVVWLALDQLEKFKLLEKAPVAPARLSGMSRRQAVRALGVAAIVLPMVTSLVVPTAAQSGSPPPIPPGGCCVSPNQCVSQTCQQEPPGVPACTVFPPNPQNSGKFCQ
jgi:hypothetical protein